VHINNNVMSSTTTNVNNSNIIKANSTTMSATIAAAAANSAASTPTNTPLYERIVSEEVRELREYVRIIETQSRRLVDLERLHVDLESRLEVEHVRSRKLERTLAQHEKKWRSVFKNLVDEKEHAERMVREEKVKVDKLMEMVNRLQTEIHALIKNKFQQHNQHGNSNIHHHQQQQQSLRLPRSAMSASVTTDHNSPHHHLNGNSNTTTTIASASTTNNGGGIRPSSSSFQQQHQQPIPQQAQANNGGNDRNSGDRKDRGNMIGPHEILAYNGSAEAVRERNALGSLLDFFGM
jgi:predicted ribosome quality control (RQC) complex YloA/Tae2 family protein